MTETLRMTSDAELIAGARSGEAAAFGEIVDRHKDALVGYLYRMVGNRERAEDVAQEAFLRLFQRSRHYQERGQLKAYLFRIATNLVRSEERRAFRWDRIRSFLRPGLDASPPQERELLETELQRELLQAIAALPVRYRAPLVLREIDGWRYRAISEALGCSEGTVKSRIHRGRSLLRQRLSHYWQGATS
ncbi:MAG: RNA polymerase sigma factor [Thermoanaerobaculia bacterium]